MKALIGYTGFVGSTLMKQIEFDDFYRSTNIEEIKGKEYDLLICSGAPAQKWLACKEPEADIANINKLMGALATVKVKKVILMSTVDVFKSSMLAYENTPVDENDLNPYGLHRRILEKFVANTFTDSLVVRLPGLVGPGLKKNIIYDFQHDNNLSAIDSRGIFQFYPMVNLWSDIENALSNHRRLVHFTSEPISVSEVAKLAFGLDFMNEIVTEPAVYDMKSIYCDPKSNGYMYSKREILMAIRNYIQTTPKI
jgi:nucleoside-diphosphate-sugar epimerase